MKYYNRILVLLAAMVVALASYGQSTRDLRFNEMLIKNTNNFDDEYGRHVPWIEIFNTAYNTVNLAGCYLTDDTTGFAAVGRKGGHIPAHWYRIPKTDINTAMPQRSFVVFFMDNQPLYGTFHVNFDPRTSKTNYVALISGDGKDLIDIMTYPKAQLMDTCLSFGLRHDGMNKETAILDHFTPGSSNETAIEATKQERLKQDDPYGIGLAIISMSVVFTALIIIFIMLKLFGLTAKRNAAKEAAKASFVSATPEQPAAETAPSDQNEGVSGEELAAIATALHLHLNSMHDEESEVLTINRPSALYSPWAQKGLTMKKNPRLRR